MVEHKSTEQHAGTHTHKENLVADEHKVAKTAHKVDSAIYMGEVIASGKPKRIERYFLRKIAYKLFGKFLGKTLNKI